MPRVPSLGFPLVLAVLVSACGVGHTDWGPGETVVETRRLDPDGTVSIENQNGSVRVDTWAESTVRIEAEKRAAGIALKSIRIEIRGEGDRIDIETRLPRGSFFGHAGAVRYHVTVPERARVKVETANGRVEVRGLSGPVRASTVNGSVEVEGSSGRVEASTVNGSIRASLRDVAPEWHRFSTTNGSVDVSLPGGAGGEFEARTVNGRIETAFPLTVSGGRGSRRLQGRLGEGKARFEMSTVNGSVRIEKM